MNVESGKIKEAGFFNCAGVTIERTEGLRDMIMSMREE